MTPVSAIKTREDALALISSIEAPHPQSLPALKDGAGEAEKAKHAQSAAAVERNNVLIQREASLIESVKTLATSRINAVPESCKVVGLEIRASSGDIETISIRIIQHK